MIRLLLAAALLSAPLALTRAESDDAYGSLIGMADSATTDKGPDAGEMPSDDGSVKTPEKDAPAAEAPPAEEAHKTEAAPVVKPAAPARPAARERKDDDGISVAAPVAPAPRVWTRLFASLLPPATKPDSFELAVSTSSARLARPVARASAAGSAQGMLELVATATAPTEVKTR